MKRPDRIITTKIFLALFFTGTFYLVGFISLEWSAQKQIGLGKLINISGRQRMLSQRITLLVNEINDNRSNQELKEDLKEKVILFKNSHELLKQEINPEELLKKGSISNHYNDELNQLTEKFLNEVSDSIESKEKASLNSLNFFAKNELLKSLNKAVTLFEKESDRLTQNLAYTERIIFFVSLLSLILSYILILAPMRDQIVQRELDLEEAKRTAENEAHYKSMFLANMGHELRTPLNGVLGVTDLLQSTQLDKEQKDYLSIINESGTMLLSIINNILDLTKLGMDQVKLESIPFSPDKQLNSLSKTFKYALDAKSIELKYDTLDLPEVLIGDKLRINQILNNLLSNAIKFTESGSVTISANYSNNQYNISIKDSGIGMSEEVSQRVFDSFKQADATTTRKYGGTGLGLTITKELVKIMHGKISVKSEVNFGSTFFITLPIPIGKIQDLKDSDQDFNDDKKFNSQNVLVVDDNAINRKLLVKTLDRQKINAKEAASGEEALQLLVNFKFDLVLMDYHMPGLNGVETYQMAKATIPNLPPTVALTADLTEETKQLVLEAGMKEVVGKPLRKMELKNLLTKYLLG
jgi:signal transduction histidine kinase/CheY-like chemotaxis protein